NFSKNLAATAANRLRGPAIEGYGALPAPSHPRSRNAAMLKLKRIDNMDIVTRDVDRLAAFYHRDLGLDFFLPYEPGQSWAAIDLGNLTLYLLKTELGEHVPRRAATGAQNLPGLDSFAFEVEDLDAAMAELEGKVEWVSPQIG